MAFVTAAADGGDHKNSHDDDGGNYDAYYFFFFRVRMFVSCLSPFRVDSKFQCHSGVDPRSLISKWVLGAKFVFVLVGRMRSRRGRKLVFYAESAIRPQHGKAARPGATEQTEQPDKV